jgi:hypothetical protein
VVVSGTGTKAGVSKSFEWTFDTPTKYSNCQLELEEGQGFQITVHADHLFYDSLISEDPGVRFQALADADTDGDGVITQSELAATDIGSYDPGSEGVEDLWAWLVAQSQTMGHFNGEGHCDASAQ